MAAALDAEQARIRRKLTFDTPFWAGGVTRDEAGAWRFPRPGEFPGCAKILDKRRQLVNTVPHPWQLQFDEILERQRREGKPMRAIVLKARKLGFSTWIALKFLQRLTMLEYQHAIIVAQDVKTAGVIFDMARICHDKLPTMDELGLDFNIRPHIVGANFAPNGRKYMQFGEATRRLRQLGRTGDSVLEIDTANTPESGRGYTPSMLHLSEVARWEGQQAARKMIALLNAIPEESETIVVLESTANGLNHFYRRWVSAREGSTDPDTGEVYVPLFVPWHADPRAIQPFATEEDRSRFADGIGRTDMFGEVAEDEPMLVEAFGCTPEQIAWRRMMIRTKHDQSVSLFNQENPYSDDAAFIGSGRTVFSSLLVTRTIKAAEDAPAPVVGTLRPDPDSLVTRRTRSGTTEVPERALWVPDSAARGGLELRVWQHPVKEAGEWPAGVPPEDRVDGAYVIGVDVSRGEADTFSAGDFHVAQVFDHRSHEQVALHASRVDIHELPMFLLLLARYYNTAWLAVEIDGPGIAVVDTLVKTFRYPKMYRRRRMDKTRDEVEDRPGWATTQVTKPIMEQTFATALAQETHGLRDAPTARELSTYVITEKGKHEAQYGEYDDRLMAAMIAHEVMGLLMPPRRRPKGGKAAPQGRDLEFDPVTGDFIR